MEQSIEFRPDATRYQLSDTGAVNTDCISIKDRETGHFSPPSNHSLLEDIVIET